MRIRLGLQAFPIPLLSWLLLSQLLATPAYAQREIFELDETCTISILNRVVQSDANGVFTLPNVPSNQGQVRARASCVRNGITVSAQTDYFEIATNGVIQVGDFFTGDLDPIPRELRFTHLSNDPEAPASSNVILDGIDDSFTILVEALYADGSTEDVTPASSGINYGSSNPTIATVSADGLLTALSSGTVLVTARKDGALTALQATVLTSGDTDGDGMPDDFERENGLNLNDPIDAFEDQDADGLSALDEFTVGTGVNDPDSDGDGLFDGEEVLAGADGFITNPLLLDTDGDGISDGLEITAGSDPTDANDLSVSGVLAELEVTPNGGSISFNQVEAVEDSIQLQVTGVLVDGSNLDLTSTQRGSSYSSADLSVCNLGAESGEVFIVDGGLCEITIVNDGISAVVSFDIEAFAPQLLSIIEGGFTGTGVFVEDDVAYVTADPEGLAIIDISDPENPFILGRYDTPGVAKDVRVQNGVAYVADGANGLMIIGVNNPAVPNLLARLELPGNAVDLSLRNNRAYVASANSAPSQGSLHVIDIANPSNPSLLDSIDAAANLTGVDVNEDGNIAVLTASGDGVQIVSLLSASPAVISSLPTSDAQDVEIVGNQALVAELFNGFVSVDFSDPFNPFQSSGVGFVRLNDIAVSGPFSAGADVNLNNAVPIVSALDPADLSFLTSVNLPGNAAGIGIDMNNQYIYMLGSNGLLFIIQYRRIDDTDGDGLFDDEELAVGTNPDDPDTDGDGLNDGFEVEFGFDPLVPDDVTADDDVDGLILLEEQEYGTDPGLADSDSDGLLDGDEANQYFTDPSKFDTDADALGDGDEIQIHGTDPNNWDTDGDGSNDGLEISLGTDPLDPDEGFVLFDTPSLIEATDFSVEGARILVVGTELTINGAHSFRSLELQDGAVLRHGTATVNKLALTVEESVLVDATSTIDLTGLGVQPSVENVGRAGGSYGGIGGLGEDTGATNPSFGDYLLPTDYGVGAGGIDSNRGGGAIELSADTLELAGTILANGASSGNTVAGSSGGSVLLELGTLRGNGTINVDGEDARVFSTSNRAPYGGGGGGRVAIYYDVLDGFDIISQVSAIGGQGSRASSTGDAGGAGTIYSKNQLTGAAELYLASSSNPNHSTGITLLAGDFDGRLRGGGASDGALVQLASDFVAVGGEILVDNYTLELTEARSFERVEIVNTGVLRHPLASDQVRSGIDLTVNGTLLVDASSRIDVSGIGDLAAATNIGRAGGSYGGIGGLGDDTGATNPSFGDYLLPQDFGVGGGGNALNRGGGAVRITAGELHIDGIIEADGGSIGNTVSGSSGGSVFLDVGVLTGSGSITADGEDSRVFGNRNLVPYGGGGGGRVAIYYDALDGFDIISQVSAIGGQGSRASSTGDPGGAGTIYSKNQLTGAAELYLASSSNPDHRTGTTLLAGDFDGRLRGGGANDGALVQLASDFVAVGGEILVDNYTLELTEARSFERVEIINTGVLRHPLASDQVRSGIDLTVNGTLLVDASSRIDVSGIGDLAPASNIGRAGGSYGGIGGLGVDTGATNPSFGDYLLPLDFGVGGGGNELNRGGGAVRIAADELRIDGVIEADGGSIGNNVAGSSGGSVLLEVGVLAGSGSISADGEDARLFSNSSLVPYGGGGGGRIAIYFDSLDNFDLESQVSVIGGQGSRSNTTGDPGGAGTIYTSDEGNGTALISIRGDDNPDRQTGITSLGGVIGDRLVIQDATLHIEDNTVLNNSSFSGNGFLVPQGSFNTAGGDLTMDGLTLLLDGEHSLGELNLINGANLTHSLETTDPLVLTVAGTLTIDGTSSIDLNDLGFTDTADVSGIAGGSHAGLGGLGSLDDTSNAPYGSYLFPNDIGTGGINIRSNESRGGGAITLLTGELLVDGSISADSSPTSAAAGGAGGSILIQTGTLSGNGLISANGSPATIDSFHFGPRGGGGGGRIAIYYSSLDGFDLVSQLMATGGNGTRGGQAAGAGTIYTQAVGQSGDLFVDNSNQSSLLPSTYVISLNRHTISAVAEVSAGLWRVEVAGTPWTASGIGTVSRSLDDLLVDLDASELASPLYLIESNTENALLIRTNTDLSGLAGNELIGEHLFNTLTVTGSAGISFGEDRVTVIDLGSSFIAPGSSVEAAPSSTLP